MLCTRNWTDEELKVAQEWIKRDSRHLPLGRHCYCPDVCYRRSNILTFYLCFSFFGLVVFGFGIYVGYVFVRPYRLSMGFQNATCVTTKAVLDLESPWRACSCGWWCESSYPCLRLYVNATSYNEDLVLSGMLHDSEIYMDGPCTIEPECQREKEDNRKAVEGYMERLGPPGQETNCLYSSDNKHRIITEQRSDPYWVLNLLLWPNMVALMFFAAVFTICLTCGHRYVCVASPPEEVSQEASHRVEDQAMEQLSQNLEEGCPLRRTSENDYAAIKAEPC